MELISQRCCGIDIQKKTLVACVITPDPKGQRQKEVRTFRTITRDLLALRDWLQEAHCTHVAMESTGVYWKPAFHLLEGDFEVLIVNAQHIKAVPGRKTDVRDAEWIADLLHHGLLKGSFIPPAPQRELRDLTRYRSSLVQERARAVNRLQKTLEDTHLKLGDVATDIMGKSARAMLEALLAGQTDPAVLANVARGRLKAKRAELERALTGVLKPHHRFLLREQLTPIETLDEAITQVRQEIEVRMAPEEIAEQEPLAVEPEQVDKKQPLTWAMAVSLLSPLPGSGQRAAEGILAEIGRDRSRFPSANHLSS